MGGNNPLIVWHTSNITPAVYDIIQSAYITSGQRCTCARRLIIPKGPDGDDLLHTLIQAVERLDVAAPDTRPEPFMGPVISGQAAQAVLDAQRAMTTLGCLPLIKARLSGANPCLLRPGLLEATGVVNIPDVEVFGPLLQVIRVDSFDRAVQEANDTRYGLAAGLLSDDPSLFDIFFARSRAGVVNFNRPTTGASGALPFGGVGLSGNHRPSGYFAVDYCAYPVASLEHPSLSLPTSLSPGVHL
jgi:succinylglutamic semialdehyde dehydrogenase